MQSWDLRSDRLVVSCFLSGDKSAVREVVFFSHFHGVTFLKLEIPVKNDNISTRKFFFAVLMPHESIHAQNRVKKSFRTSQRKSTPHFSLSPRYSRWPLQVECACLLSIHKIAPFFPLWQCGLCQSGVSKNGLVKQGFAKALKSLIFIL